MKIYIICPVRNVTEKQTAAVVKYVEKLESEGHEVHYPPRDVNQEDVDGYKICLQHGKAMIYCERVDIFWDVNSSGSHFDLGMAYAFNKKIKFVRSFHRDNDGKSFLKVIKRVEKEGIKYYKL